MDNLTPRAPDPGSTTKAATDLKPGDAVLIDSPAGVVTGQVCCIIDNPVPGKVRVHVTNLPRPTLGWQANIDTAADHQWEVDA